MPSNATEGRRNCNSQKRSEFQSNESCCDRFVAYSELLLICFVIMELLVCFLSGGLKTTGIHRHSLVAKELLKSLAQGHGANYHQV